MVRKGLIAAVGVAVALEGVAANAPVYTLAAPRVAILRNVTRAVDIAREENAWAVSNGCLYAGASAAHFAGSNMGGTEAVLNPILSDDPSLPVRKLGSSVGGFPVERNKPQYYLGDALDAPEGTDWEATYSLFAADSTASNNFLFDTKNNAVYVIAGETARFSWVIADTDSPGARHTNEIVTISSPVARERPKNIFWTDAKYGGRTVDLSGKFVRFFGPSEILTKRMGQESTGTTIGDQESMRDVVLSGLYIDETGGKRTLYAAGELRGQVVMVYYDSPLCDRIVDVQVVEVSQPQTDILSATVGGELHASGRGYDITGLVASPTTMDDPDGKGPYLYQHNGQYPYSPKHKSVFAIRPTDDKTRNQTQIYWMEIDNQGVSWPFEVDEYRVSWPEDIAIFVRSEDASAPGKGATIPSVYSAELMTYQEDFGAVANHARAPENGVFTTYGPGRSLMKLTGNDNIWFLAVESVLRTDPSWYTNLVTEVLVGEEMLLRGGSVSGLAEGRSLAVDADVPGWIYEPHSAPVWNPHLYSENGVAANDLPSAIFPVTAAIDRSVTNTVEVWWSTNYRQPDMPESVRIPALPQRYGVRWPTKNEAPQITIASQEGSAGISGYCDGGTLVFDDAGSYLELPSRTFFDPTEGSISFSLGAYTAEAARQDSAIASFGDTNGTPFVTIGCLADGTIRARLGSAELSVKATNTAEWAAVTISWSGTAASMLYLGDAGLLTANATLSATDLAALGQCLYGNRIGATAGRPAAPMRMVDEFICRRNAMDFGTFFVCNAMGIDAGVGVPSLEFTFDRAGDLVASGNGEWRSSADGVLGTVHRAWKCLKEEPGSAKFKTNVIASDTLPVIYRQNDPSAVGYNPNEEHAIVRAGEGGYVVWAIRCDLNDAGTKKVSEPGVLVEYSQNGKAKMRYFNVVATDVFSPFLEDTCTAGLQLPGPLPLTLFDDPWLEKTKWPSDAVPPYRDRKNQVWARAAGEFDIFMYYAQQDGFDWPEGLATPAIGDPIPWLAYLDGGKGQEPHPWHWTVEWPKEAPEMRIGQTLTDAADGLPEMWNASSMAVVYPNENTEDVVLLTDPTASRTADLGCRASDLARIGLAVGPGQKLAESKGLYYFQGVSPSVAHRLYIDPSTDRLVLHGERESNPGGVELLYVNVLSEADVAEVMALVTEDDAEIKPLFETALRHLGSLGLIKPTTVGIRTVDEHIEVGAEYQPKDHYALTAMGMTNWVTLIENDATNDWCDAGNPVNMRVIKVIPEYYTGRVVTREDPKNLLSQMLDVIYSEPFAGRAGDYIFDWRKASPRTDGTVPSDYEGEYQPKFSEEDGRGKTSFTVGGQGDTLANMVNTYWTCRYRAASNTVAHAVMGEKWSDWIEPPALAEGWVQRVLNNITPFTQRMTDLYENEAETAVTMLQQAGKPYTGDVTLNQDNLTSVGLIELYRTILSKAESMSLLLGVNDAGANKQLLLAVERLADLYNVLGDEAYSDAANPTVGFGSNFGDIEGGLSLNYGAASSALFCFDNQLPTLLDEELALLRGRSCVNAPGNTVGPYYNRLVWNFTRGITAGEVAYAVNYNISGHRNSSLDASTAAELYPQGHGDAYGHYLSALQGWYRLLRNPNFSWGTPAMGEMNVADNVVNVDYYDEAKFADTAAAVARTAKRTVELTALKHWRDQGADSVGGGYVDANVTNAFGYGEWASRGTFGALCNWAVANSLLPEAETTDETGAKYADKGLLRIDRSTVGGIGEIASAAESIQRTVDRMDAGLNPLGLDENAIPFDLTPIGSATDKTHYEQIRERAAKAFANAKAILDRAQEYGNRLRLIDEARAGIVDNLDTAESDANAELISLFGRPYSDDIGPGKTYKEGYYGPDLYHYMWMNAADYGLSGVDASMVVTTVVHRIAGYSESGAIVDLVNEAEQVVPSSGGVLSYSLCADGVVITPPTISGKRPANGELQAAYAEFLCNLSAVKCELSGYQRKRNHLRTELDFALAELDALRTLESAEDDTYDDGDDLYHYIDKLSDEKKSIAAFQSVVDMCTMSLATEKSAVGVIGLATTAAKDLASGAYGVAQFIVANVANGVKVGLQGDVAECERQISRLQAKLNEADRAYAHLSTRIAAWERVETAVAAEASALGDLIAAWNALAASQEQVSSLVQKGRLIQEARELNRQQAVNNISKMRYNDMFFRKLRNDALAKYDAAFDLAKKYAFLAAKAYGYETGSMPDELVRSILAARSLGETDAKGEPIVSSNGDAGLAGALATMDANWVNLKTQLGLNNPQPYATWFSLRHELFRILRGELGDAAWRTELTKHWADDIRTNPDFIRHCQPFVSQFGLANKEPGLVITFETTVDFACNLFGKPLAYDDSQFDSSWYATKIAAAGVWFENYNARSAGYSGHESAFAATPNVYLVPIGTDQMRVPGSDGAEIAGFDVVDQTIPVPYPVTSAEIAEANWLPSYLKGEFGGVDAVTRIRRHPSFRAYYGPEGAMPTDAQLDAVRLTGRSVWNTKWMLVIPAGTLGSNREKALDAFVHGLDINGDGRIDILPVSDIRIGFKTYSIGGK